jgi:hypothetical protein
MFRESLRANRSGRTALGAAIAGLVTCALMLVDYMSFRAQGPYAAGTAILLIGLALWVVVGATAGLVSGRFRDAPVSWAAALVGVLLARQIFYAVLFPSSPYPGEDGFEGDIVPIASALLLLIAGGHLLGVVVHRNLGRRKLNAVG